MTPSKLAQARIERGFTQPQVAEYMAVDVGTVCRWEKGTQRPYPRHVMKLCTLYDKSVQQLGLIPESEEVRKAQEVLEEVIQGEAPTLPRFPTEASPKESGVSQTFAKFFQRDLGLRFDCIKYNWQHQQEAPSSYVIFQHQINQAIEDTMNEQQPKQNHTGVDRARREALRRLALFPIHVLGLSTLAVSTAPSRPEDLLTHCAAGITACDHLSNGLHEDMTLASSVLSTYLPSLKAMVDESSLHRKEAARLVAQASLIKMLLSVHREGSKQAISYGRQAVTYSKESGDFLLWLGSLRRLSWLYLCDNQALQAKKTALRAQHLLEHATEYTNIPVPPLMQSAIYAGTARCYAATRQKDEVLSALHQAHDTFPDSDSSRDMLVYAEHNRAHLFMYEGLAYYHLRQYKDASTSFAQAIDPETLLSQLPLSSERVRVEIINHQVLASLMLPNKDKEQIRYGWVAGMQGAQALRSEQRFNEAMTAYRIMQALWPDEKDIEELEEFTQHW
ncbi:MAG TPA: helix-turn-helix transcriptional regulator [Ktedonobacteraceae bacterium]|nr:helix-turn-helix transcriptional regulator [Ktedonobacteraceae bacterium]